MEPVTLNDQSINPMLFQLFDPLLWPMLLHIALVVLLYVLLTVARAPAVWGIGKRADNSNPFADYEPRISANLSNQFEWPVFFYIACVLQMLQGPDTVQLWLAWIFVFGRYLHSAVQIMINNIRLRGLVFTINFVVVIGMYVRLVLNSANGA